VVVSPSSPGCEADLADIKVLVYISIIAIDVKTPGPPAEFDLGSIAAFRPFSLGSGILKAELDGFCSYGTIDVDDTVEVILCVLVGVENAQAGVLQDLPLNSENRETALGFYQSGILAGVLDLSGHCPYSSDPKPPEFPGEL